jgi:hypothetical protein
MAAPAVAPAPKEEALPVAELPGKDLAVDRTRQLVAAAVAAVAPVV